MNITEPPTRSTDPSSLVARSIQTLEKVKKKKCAAQKRKQQHDEQPIHSTKSSKYDDQTDIQKSFTEDDRSDELFETKAEDELNLLSKITKNKENGSEENELSSNDDTANDHLPCDRQKSTSWKSIQDVRNNNNKFKVMTEHDEDDKIRFKTKDPVANDTVKISLPAEQDARTTRPSRGKTENDISSASSQLLPSNLTSKSLCSSASPTTPTDFVRNIAANNRNAMHEILPKP